jgi:hydrogenase maturation protease
VPRPRALVLYLGNPIVRDDQVGLLVGARLAAELAGRLEVREFEGSPLDLIAEIEGYDQLVLVDAVATGAPVGTVRLFDEQQLVARGGDAYPHGLNLGEALALGRRLGAALPRRIHLVGIEVRPALEFGEGLSPELARGLDRILEETRQLLRELVRVAETPAVPPGGPDA